MLLPTTCDCCLLSLRQVGGTVLHNSGDLDGFLARFDSSTGAVTLLRSFGGSGADSLTHLAVTST